MDVKHFKKGQLYLFKDSQESFIFKILEINNYRDQIHCLQLSRIRPKNWKNNSDCFKFDFDNKLWLSRKWGDCIIPLTKLGRLLWT